MNTTIPSKTLEKAFIISVVSLILGLAFDYLFFKKFPGVNFPLYVILILIALLGITTYLKKRLNSNILWAVIPLLFFSSMVFIRESFFLTFLNIVASLALLVLITRIALSGTLKNFVIADYLKLILIPFQSIPPLFQTLTDLLTLKGVSKDNKTALQIVKGVVMAVPLLIIFLVLFSSADLIFQKYVSDIFNIEPETVLRTILIIIASLSCIGAFSYIFKSKEETTSEKKEPARLLGSIETSILLGSVNVLFFLFILIQLTYLFGGEATLASQGLTYAEYARRGFFELLAVAVISFLVLLGMEYAITRKENKHSTLFKILGSVLIVQVLIIMLSSFLRLSLYEQAYGFTIDRLFSHAFTILLAVVFILLLYKIITNGKDNTFAFSGWISLVAFLMVMNLLNPDAFIARQNIERYANGGELDTYYLSRLSSDALPETIKVLDIANETVRNSFARDLYWRDFYQQQDRELYEPWQAFHISRNKGQQILTSKMLRLEAQKQYNLEGVTMAMPVGASCTRSSECATPGEYLIQSNCPFVSACIDSRCKVVCPLATHDPNQNISTNYSVACTENSDCNCAERGDRALACVCTDGNCVSIEAE